MGYGLGVFLLAVGLILALAVTDMIEGVDLTMVGWILTAAGLLLLLLTAITQLARGRGSYTRTTNPDGSETVRRQDPPL